MNLKPPSNSSPHRFHAGCYDSENPSTSPLLAPTTMNLKPPSDSGPDRFSIVHSGCYESENPSTASTPFVSAPSSPGRNGRMPGFYLSAPTSPTWTTRMQEPGRNTGYDLPFPWDDQTNTGPGVPFSWFDDKPDTPKRKSEAGDLADGQSSQSLTGSDFEFSARFLELEESMSPTPMSSANELFLNGQIRPLRPPPRFQKPPSSVRQLLDADAYSFDSRSCVSCPVSAPHSPRSLKSDGRRSVKGNMSRISDPRRETSDSFAMAIKEMRKTSTDSRHRRFGSLSPFRIFNLADETASKSIAASEKEVESTSRVEKNVDKRSSSSSCRKWTLKGFLRGGDGKAQSQDGSSRHWPDSTLKQSSRGSRNSESSQSSVDWEKDRNRSGLDHQGSSRSKASNASAKGRKSSPRPQKGSMSPHELHYAKQRAQTEELKRKTFLPYRQGLLGCLGFSSKSYRAMTSLSNALQPIS